MENEKRSAGISQFEEENNRLQLPIQEFYNLNSYAAAISFQRSFKKTIQHFIRKSLNQLQLCLRILSFLHRKEEESNYYTYQLCELN